MSQATAALLTAQFNKLTKYAADPRLIHAALGAGAGGIGTALVQALAGRDISLLPTILGAGVGAGAGYHSDNIKRFVDEATAVPGQIDTPVGVVSGKVKKTLDAGGALIDQVAETGSKLENAALPAAKTVGVGLVPALLGKYVGAEAVDEVSQGAAKNFANHVAQRQEGIDKLLEKAKKFEAQSAGLRTRSEALPLLQRANRAALIAKAEAAVAAAGTNTAAAEKAKSVLKYMQQAEAQRAARALQMSKTLRSFKPLLATGVLAGALNRDVAREHYILSPVATAGAGATLGGAVGDILAPMLAGIARRRSPALAAALGRLTSNGGGVSRWHMLGGLLGGGVGAANAAAAQLGDR